MTLSHIQKGKYMDRFLQQFWFMNLTKPDTFDGDTYLYFLQAFGFHPLTFIGVLAIIWVITFIGLIIMFFVLDTFYKKVVRHLLETKNLVESIEKDYATTINPRELYSIYLNARPYGSTPSLTDWKIAMEKNKARKKVKRLLVTIEKDQRQHIKMSEYAIKNRQLMRIKRFILIPMIITAVAVNPLTLFTSIPVIIAACMV
jgi:hypothetical protein